ncbi:putative DMT superfamily transporter inner membrane protein [Burkholderia oklahomensis]|nr:putative DMT superfamily transporter inner membrane protein [Burkholderia oklahomensis]
MLETRRPLDAMSIAIMLVLCFCWGSQQVLIKVAAPRVDPLMQLSIRYGISAIVLGCFLFRRYGRRVLRDGTFGAGVAVGLLVAVESIAIAQGLRYTSSSHVTVLLYTGPLFASFGMHFTHEDERLSALQWLLMFVAFSGIVVSFLGRDGAAGGGSLVGDGFGLLSGIAWGATTVVVKRTRLSNAPAEKTLFYQVAVSTVVILPLTILMGRARIAADAVTVANLAFQTFVLVLGTFLAWYWLLTKYLASRLSIIQLITPIVGVTLGYFALDDALSVWFVCGAAMVIFGIVGIGVIEALNQGRRARDARLERASARADRGDPMPLAMPCRGGAGAARD